MRESKLMSEVRTHIASFNEVTGDEQMLLVRC